MSWQVSEVKELKGYTVEWAGDSGFYLSRSNKIFFSKSLIKPFEHVATVTAPFWKQAASNFRLAQRFLRFMVTNVLPLSNGNLFVTFDKTVGVISKGDFRPLKGLVRPCRVLRSACTVDHNGDIYFGEYLVMKDTGEIRIYRYSPGNDDLEVVYTFANDEVLHVHGLYFDEFTNAVFCLTGDRKSECRILRSFDGCKTFETVGSGDETWRAVSILFAEDSFYYGTDAEHRENHIYRVNRQTLERTPLLEVSGTVFYSKKVGSDMFFATTAENAPSQKENVAAIWHIDPEGKGSHVASFRKDGWHGTLFQFGTIHFPSQSVSDSSIYFHLVGVDEDNRMFELKQV